MLEPLYILVVHAATESGLRFELVLILTPPGHAYKQTTDVKKTSFFQAWPSRMICWGSEAACPQMLLQGI